jgi:hypothetical protein
MWTVLKRYFGVILIITYICTPNAISSEDDSNYSYGRRSDVHIPSSFGRVTSTAFSRPSPPSLAHVSGYPHAYPC